MLNAKKDLAMGKDDEEPTTQNVKPITKDQ